jgi:nucleoside-diphosphate-sugar epimerase
MHVFVPGTTGWIGIAVVKELLGPGHTVLGLARSDAGAKALATLGADVLRGTIEEQERLKEGAAATDGVIHLALQTTFDDFEGACKLDREAIEAMGAVLAGSNRPLIMTTGTLAVPGDHLSTEDDECDCNSPLRRNAGQRKHSQNLLHPRACARLSCDLRQRITAMGTRDS